VVIADESGVSGYHIGSQTATMPKTTNSGPIQALN
jgi:hypothetical protein